MIKEGKQAELGMKRQFMSIMFININNMKYIMETYNKPVISMSLGYLYREITEIIEKNHGVVDKYMGDGYVLLLLLFSGNNDWLLDRIMAFWNLPQDPRSDHEYLATVTALKCTKIIETLQKTKRWREQKLPDVSIRIGINSGEGGL